jgi:uncharacterized protein HemX
MASKTMTAPWSSTTPSQPPRNTDTGAASTSSSGGLSTPAKAAIGASVGGVALIALVVLALFFWRKRKSQHAPYHQTNQEVHEDHAAETGPYTRAELAADNDIASDNEQQHVGHSLSTHKDAHELVSNVGTRPTAAHTSSVEISAEAVRIGEPERR